MDKAYSFESEYKTKEPKLRFEAGGLPDSVEAVGGKCDSLLFQRAKLTATLTVLGVHCMHLFYNRCEPVMENALYEIENIRQYAGLKLDYLPNKASACVKDE